MPIFLMQGIRFITKSGINGVWVDMNGPERLKKNREKLINAFLNGRETDFLNRHAALIDAYFCDCFEKSMAGPRIALHKQPYAIVALGGYGRREQCIGSDVDILFLFNRKIPAEVEALVKEMIYPLWDIGFDVGHATRTVKECIDLSMAETEVLTSILDARFICGVSALFSQLMEAVRNRIINGRTDKVIARIVEANRRRHDKYGDSSYRLEPNLKQGDGGLRDYHTMLWMAKVEMNIKDPRDLEYYGYLSDQEYEDISRSLSFIWTIRNHLHLLSGRKYDRLHFEYQRKIAGILRFRDTKEQMAVEKFLGELHGRMERIKNQSLMLLFERGYTGNLKSKRKKVKKTTRLQGLTIERDMLNFATTEDILDAPFRLMQIFEESARLKIPVNSEGRRVVKEFVHLVGNDFRKDERNIRSFERILLSGTYAFDVLNDMLHTGFLMRFIPEMKKIYNRIQFDAYHLYPVDRHSLYTVKVITTFSSRDWQEEDLLYRTLYQGLGRYKKLLLWAALLHDTGKGGEGDNHSQKGALIAGKIMKRSGYSPSDAGTVSFLVSEHLLLAKIATRRDMNDEETALVCARRIKHVRLLKMLYLLTVADSMSTGPKAWNEWTSTLLRDLFFKILKILERGELATSRAVERVEKKKALLSKASGHNRETVAECFRIFSPRYLLYTSVKEISDHIRLYKRLKDSDFVWDISKNKGSDTRNVAVCAKDRPGLFSKISGVFTLNGLDILDVQAYTWKNNVAFDIFTVKAPPDPIFEDDTWKRARGHLHDVLNRDLDIKDELIKRASSYERAYNPVRKKADHVKIDNSSSSFFTIVEVFANDRPGLLFQIADALYRCDLNVHVAKIATKVDQAADIFYVRDLDERKIDEPEREVEIREAVIEALASSN